VDFVKPEIGDTRFARRAARESGGLNGLKPRVALADSGNPGLDYSTPLGSSACRVKRGIELPAGR